MTPRFFISVAALMLCLYSVDKFLAGVEHGEIVREAASLHQQGEKLLAKGGPLEAIGPLRHSVALLRTNRGYRLALANALLAVGRLEEAELSLRDLLESDSNDSSVNLSMARLQARLEHRREAEAYYHRATYGTWPAGHFSCKASSRTRRQHNAESRSSF